MKQWPPTRKWTRTQSPFSRSKSVHFYSQNDTILVCHYEVIALSLNREKEDWHFYIRKLMLITAAVMILMIIINNNVKIDEKVS